MEKLDLQKKVASLPKLPGVYLMQGKGKKIIYIGKAKNLFNRVKSYFGGYSGHDPKTAELVRHIVWFEYIVTNSEYEALILEANLIKKHKPKYNIMLKDDKRYPFLKITDETFPRLVKTREKVLMKGERLFGPYTEASNLNIALRLIEKIFPLRKCNRTLTKVDQMPCLNYQIKKCPGPCAGYISREEYNETVKNVISFLRGHTKEIKAGLKERMERAAENLEFEKAALCRDQLSALDKINRKQIIYFPDNIDRDVIAFSRFENDGCMVILKIREGKLIDKESYFFSAPGSEEEASLLESLIVQYYLNRDTFPKEIIAGHEPEGLQAILDYISESRNTKAVFTVPKIGTKLDLLKMAKNNSFRILEEKKIKQFELKARVPFSLQEMKEKLRLTRIPQKMVCFDISTNRGNNTVASAVYFFNGKPLKKNYRKFTIKSVILDDFRSINEAVDRYLKNVKEEDVPDLIIIDGGKGQLGFAWDALQKYPNINADLISIAKRLEEIFKVGRKEPLMLPKSSAALKTIQKIRDEAHRFAITFHRQRQSKSLVKSELDEISGIGPKRKTLLLNHFGSVENIRRAEVKDLEKLKLPRKIAEEILEYLKKD